MSKSVSVDEAIARFDAAIEKDETPCDVEAVRSVLAGPVEPWLHVSVVSPNIEPLDNPDANRIFQAHVKAYIQNGGEPDPSPAILETLRIGAELQALREQKLGRILENSGIVFEVDGHAEENL